MKSHIFYVFCAVVSYSANAIPTEFGFKTVDIEPRRRKAATDLTLCRAQTAFGICGEPTVDSKVLNRNFVGFKFAPVDEDTKQWALQQSTPRRVSSGYIPKLLVHQRVSAA